MVEQRREPYSLVLGALGRAALGLG